MTDDDVFQRLKKLRVDRVELEGRLRKVCDEIDLLDEAAAIKRVLAEAVSLCNVALQGESDPTRTLNAALYLRNAARKLRDTSSLFRNNPFRISIP